MTRWGGVKKHRGLKCRAARPYTQWRVRVRNFSNPCAVRGIQELRSSDIGESSCSWFTPGLVPRFEHRPASGAGAGRTGPRRRAPAPGARRTHTGQWQYECRTRGEPSGSTAESPRTPLGHALQVEVQAAHGAACPGTAAPWLPAPRGHIPPEISSSSDFIIFNKVCVSPDRQVGPVGGRTGPVAVHRPRPHRPPGTRQGPRVKYS